MAKKRVSELQHALEDDMHYDSEGMSNDDDDDDDLSDDSDDDFRDGGSRPSEPRSYRSYDELEDDDDLSDRLKQKLNDLSDDLPRSARGSRLPADSVDSDVFETTRNDADGNESRKPARRASGESRPHRRSRSGTDEHDTSIDKRRRRSDDKRRKSVEKSRSFEKKPTSTDNSIHWRKDYTAVDYLRCENFFTTVLNKDLSL